LFSDGRVIATELPIPVNRAAAVDGAPRPTRLALHEVHPPDHLTPEQVEIVGG
jgi:hypothetical protein